MVEILDRDIETQIHAVPLFADLAEEDIRCVVKESQIKTYSRHATLFMQGEKADRHFVVLDGWIKLYACTPNGDETVLDIATRNDTLGEEMFFSGKHYIFSAGVLKDAVILETASDTLKEMAARIPRFSSYLLENMAARIYNLRLENEHLALMTTRERVACFVLQLLMAGKDDHCLAFPYDKNLAASRLGMKSETFSRALKSLENIGVHTESDYIYVEKKAALEECCCISCSASPHDCPLAKSRHLKNITRSAG